MAIPLIILFGSLPECKALSSADQAQYPLSEQGGALPPVSIPLMVESAVRQSNIFGVSPSAEEERRANSFQLNLAVPTVPHLLLAGLHCSIRWRPGRDQVWLNAPLRFYDMSAESPDPRPDKAGGAL